MQTIIKNLKRKAFINELENNESGNVIIIVALLMVVILGFAALVIDLGMVSYTQTRLQNAADAAALAGVRNLPTATTAKNTAITYAGKNGVLSTEVIATSPYNGDANKIEVVCTKTVVYSFAQVLGFTNTEVSARAVAQKSGSGLGAAFDYAIFSGNKYPDPLSFSVRLQNVLTMSGLTNVVNGSVHGNYNVDANTSTIIYNGEGVGTVVGNNIANKLPGSPYIEMPDFTSAVPTIKEQAIAAGQYYSGNFSIANASSLNLNQPVYVEGDANLTGISFSGEGSIYVKGKIRITGSATSYASNSNICMYSGYKSSSKADAAIDFSGSAHDFKGILYAPNGSILVTGSNYTFNGSVVGRVVDISGSNKTFKSADVADSFPYFTPISFKLTE